MAEILYGQELFTRYTILDSGGGFEPVRWAKRRLRFQIEEKARNYGWVLDGSISFRTYVQSGFSAADLLYKEEPWIVGTPLPEWAMLVRVEAEAKTV